MESAGVGRLSGPSLKCVRVRATERWGCFKENQTPESEEAGFAMGMGAGVRVTRMEGWRQGSSLLRHSATHPAPPFHRLKTQIHSFVF